MKTSLRFMVVAFATLWAFTAAYAQDAAPGVTAAASAVAQAPWPSASAPWVTPNWTLLYAVPVLVFAGALIAIGRIRGSLPSTWSLGDALSEEVALTPAKKTTTTKGVDGAADVTIEEIQTDKDGKPILLPEMRASASRVIALMGMVAMLLIYIGFAVFALFSFGSTGRLPDSLNNAVNFLLAGLTLFAPYAANKLSEGLKGVVSGK